MYQPIRSGYTTAMLQFNTKRCPKGASASPRIRHLVKEIALVGSPKLEAQYLNNSQVFSGHSLPADQGQNGE